MGSLPKVSPVQVESIVFPPSVKPPGSSNGLFLGGAGFRGLEIEGKFIKFTGIGVYLAAEAVPLLAPKWKGKTAQELADSVEFFREIITGPFEKMARVTMILPLTGQQYSDKVSEYCVTRWKTLGLFTDAEAAAAEKFKEAFKDQTFPPGATIFFTLSPPGSLKIGFSKDDSVPEQPLAVVENKLIIETILESMIGKDGVSPAARKSIAGRVAELLKECNAENTQKLHKECNIENTQKLVKECNPENTQKLVKECNAENTQKLVKECNAENTQKFLKECNAENTQKFLKECNPENSQKEGEKDGVEVKP